MRRQLRHDCEKLIGYERPQIGKGLEVERNSKMDRRFSSGFESHSYDMYIFLDYLRIYGK